MNSDFQRLLVIPCYLFIYIYIYLIFAFRICCFVLRACWMRSFDFTPFTSMSPKAYTSSSTLSSEMTAPLKPGSLEDPRIQGKQKEATKFSREVLEVHCLEAKR